MFFGALTNELSKNPERLFLLAPVFFGAGIGIYFSFHHEPTWTLIVLPLVFSALATFLSRNRQMVYLFSSACLILMLGMASAKFETHQKSLRIESFGTNTVTYIKGIVKQTDFNAKSKPRLLLKNVSDENKPLKGLYRLTTTDKTAYQTGDCVETAAVISSPFHPLKPNTYQFDRHAFFEGISAVGYTLTPFYKIECEDNALHSKPSDFLSHLRQNITTQISKTLDKDEAAITTAVLTGNKTLISKSLYTRYRISGLAHFLAISGLHIGLVAVFFFVLMRFLLSIVPYIALKFSTNKIAAVCAVLFAFAYLLLSGMSVSAERAFIMTALVFLGIVFDRTALSMRTVALAALIILAFEPHALLNAGFQMSFAAATALIAFYENYHNKPHNKSFLRSKIRLYFLSVFWTALVATLATLPYTVYHFGAFAPYAVLSNISAAPLIGFVIMPFVFTALLLYPFHLSFYPLCVAGFGLKLLNNLTIFISRLPTADFTLTPMPVWGLVLITLGGIWLCLWQQKVRFFGLVLIVLGLISNIFVQTPDVFYTSDGKTVALTAQSKNELIIFSKKKNDFTTEILAQGFQNVQTFKHPENIKSENLICTNDACTFKQIFKFDLAGNLSLNNSKIDATADLGGAIYFTNDLPRIKTVREYIGFRPWNTPNEWNFKN